MGPSLCAGRSGAEGELALRQLGEGGAQLLEVLTVEGHASRESAAQESYNQRLSERRANTVADELERSRVDSRNISSRGLGTRAPIASNETEAGRQQNRRVEVIIEN